MMKLFLCMLLMPLMSIGQVKNDTVVVQVPYNQIPKFIDSLKNVILTEATNKYKPEDLISAKPPMPGSTYNKQEYSKLYVINNKYAYKLDIMEVEKVNKFVNEFFHAEKIRAITIISPEVGTTIYGSKGISGVIAISLKKRMKFNPVGG